MAKRNEGRGLGRSFYDIMGDNFPEAKSGSGQNIRLSDIEPRRDQPRKTFEREALEVLADSIANYGVLQPIIVRESEVLAGTYEIIAGERRWRAAKMAGLTEIPAIVFDGDELKAAQVAMIENIQREDLNPVEEAMGYGALIDRFGLTQEQVAKQVGKNRSTVTNMLRKNFIQLCILPSAVLIEHFWISAISLKLRSFCRIINTSRCSAGIFFSNSSNFSSSSCAASKECGLPESPVCSGKSPSSVVAPILRRLFSRRKCSRT